MRGQLFPLFIISVLLTVTVRTTVCKYMQKDQLTIHYNVSELVLECSFEQLSE